MAQSVEHIVHIDGVVGSSPTVTTPSRHREGFFSPFFDFAPRRPETGLQRKIVQTLVCQPSPPQTALTRANGAEIDEMDMLGFLRLRAWDAREHEKKKPRQCFIDEVWPGLKPL